MNSIIASNGDGNPPQEKTSASTPDEAAFRRLEDSGYPFTIDKILRRIDGKHTYAVKIHTRKGIATMFDRSLSACVHNALAQVLHMEKFE